MVQREKKAYIPFYLEKSILKEIDLIVSDPYNMFDDRTKFIRHCVKTLLPQIKQQLAEEKKQQNRF